MACRRRDFCYSSLVWSLFMLVIIAFWFFDLGFGRCYISLPVLLLSASFTTSTKPSMAHIRQASAGYDLFSGKPRASFIISSAPYRCNHLEIDKDGIVLDSIELEFSPRPSIKSSTSTRRSEVEIDVGLVAYPHGDKSVSLFQSWGETPADLRIYQSANPAGLVLKMVAKESHRIQYASSVPDLSCYLLYTQFPAHYPSYPNTSSSLAAAHNQRISDANQRLLGILLLGFFNSGPRCNSWRFMFRNGGPSSFSTRPSFIKLSLKSTLYQLPLVRKFRSMSRSARVQLDFERLPTFSDQAHPSTTSVPPSWPRFFCILISNQCSMNTRYFSLNGRGLRPNLMSISLGWLGNARVHSLGHRDYRFGWCGLLRVYLQGVVKIGLSISSVSLSRHSSSKGQGSGFKEKVGLSYSYIRERQLPFSFSLEERIILSCPFFVRGDFSPVAKPENFCNALTALFSSVMAHSVLVETTWIINLRTEVMVSSKSYGKMTSLKLVDEFVLKSGSFTYVLEMFNSSPNNVSNWSKFVSLSLAYECFYVLAGWLLYWICPSKQLYHVSF